MNTHDDVENVVMSLAPTQFRGQRLLAGTFAPLMSLAFAVFAVVHVYLDRIPGVVYFSLLSVTLAGVTAFAWSNHLREIRRAARQFDGVAYLIAGAYRWAPGKELTAGEKLKQGFMRVKPGLVEFHTGREARIIATYTSGQLARAVILRVMRGMLEPVVRLTFTDGMTYDILLDHAGPEGLLPLRRKHLEEFIADVRSALAPTEPHT